MEVSDSQGTYFLTNVDLIDYHEKKEYPSHKKAIAAILVVFGVFVTIGVYSVLQLWEQYGSQILPFIQGLPLPSILTANRYSIALILGGLILLSVLVAMGASTLAKKLGGTLIYVGALFMNLMTWAVVIIAVVMGDVPLSALAENWPIMIPGFFTLFITILLFTVFRDRIRRAGQLIKLTGKVCLDEKGVFVPPLFTMVFTLVSAVLFGAIVFEFTPIDVILGNQAWSVDSAASVGIPLLLYLFTTIFFYNLAYGASSGMVYIYMRGRDPTLGDGVKASLGVVAGLAALAVMSVIIVLVRIALQRGGRQVGGAGGEAVGRVAGGVIGWIWALVNFFTIPAMVAEGVGAKAGIKRSAGLVRKNFVDVMIKQSAVRWAFGVLALIFFIAFAVGGAAIGWVLSGGDIVNTLIFAVVFIVLAAIPCTLVLRTFDIVYVTLLYVFIRRQEGEITGNTALSADMSRELESSYNAARRGGS